MTALLAPPAPLLRLGSTLEKNKTLAQAFALDMGEGLRLQERVGPWVAHIGSASCPPESPAYLAAEKTGRLIVERLSLPVATGGGPATMEKRPTRVPSSPAALRSESGSKGCQPSST